jgi:hypothetical protein
MLLKPCPFPIRGAWNTSTLKTITGPIKAGREDTRRYNLFSALK